MSDLKFDDKVVADLLRTIRVSDQSCTAYAILRDRYKRRSTLLDLTILLISAWLTAMIWVEPTIAERLTPHGASKEIWLGVLSVGAFALSLIQLQVNWKERANSFHQAMSVLSTYVKELRPLLNSPDIHKIEAALDRYQAITEPLMPIPESDFLKMKQRHQLKIKISKHLDEYPGTNLLLLRLVLRWRDNASLRSSSKEDNDQSH